MDDRGAHLKGAPVTSVGRGVFFASCSQTRQPKNRDNCNRQNPLHYPVTHSALLKKSVSYLPEAPAISVGGLDEGPRPLVRKRRGIIGLEYCSFRRFARLLTN